MGKHEEIAQIRQEITKLQNELKKKQEEKGRLKSELESFKHEQEELVEEIIASEASVKKLNKINTLAESRSKVVERIKKLEDVLRPSTILPVPKQGAVYKEFESEKIKELLSRIAELRQNKRELGQEIEYISESIKEVEENKALLEKLNSKNISTVKNYREKVLALKMHVETVEPSGDITEKIKSFLSTEEHFINAIRVYLFSPMLAISDLYGKKSLYGALLDQEAFMLYQEFQRDFPDIFKENMQQMDEFILRQQASLREKTGKEKELNATASAYQASLTDKSQALGEAERDIQTLLDEERRDSKQLAAELESLCKEQQVELYDRVRALLAKQEECTDQRKELEWKLEHIRNATLESDVVEQEIVKLSDRLQQKQTALSNLSDEIDAAGPAPVEHTRDSEMPARSAGGFWSRPEKEPDPSSAEHLHHQL